MHDLAVMWDWAGFAVHCLHVITAIAWIGSSFYFVALDRLQVTDPEAYPDGVIRTVQRRLKVWRRERARALVLGPSATAEADAVA